MQEISWKSLGNANKQTPFPFSITIPKMHTELQLSQTIYDSVMQKKICSLSLQILKVNYIIFGC